MASVSSPRSAPALVRRFAGLRSTRVAALCAGLAGMALAGCSAESPAPGASSGGKAAEKGCSGEKSCAQKPGASEGEKACGANSCGKK